MAAHLGVTSTFGVSIPAGTSVVKATRSTKIETFKTPGATGEWLKYTAGRTKTITVNLEGHGPAPLASVTAADAIAVATAKLISARQGESSKQTPPTFSASYPSHAAFADADAAEAAGTVPTLATIEIVSVTYSMAESLDITTQVADIVVPNAAGEPGFRATCKRESSFSISGYGDLPVVLGTGGAGVATLTGGKLILSDTEEIENEGNCNQWRCSGGHCPSAT